MNLESIFEINNNATKATRKNGVLVMLIVNSFFDWTIEYALVVAVKFCDCATIGSIRASF